MENTVYSTTWRNKWLTADATTIAEMATRLEHAAQELRSMDRAGIVLDPGSMADDYARLTTTDAQVAERFGLEIEPDDE